MKPLPSSVPALALALFLTHSVPVSFGAGEATTDPAGFTTLTVKGTGGTKASEITYLGIGLTRPVEYQALAQTVSGTVVSVASATWTANQFASTPQPGYFLEVVSGAKAGLMSAVISSTAAVAPSTPGTLTVADDLTALGVEASNVSFKVRKNWSLSTLFGPTNQAGFTGGSSTSADLILIYNPNLGGGAGGYDQFFYSTGGLAGTGWRKVGGGNTDQGNSPIALDEGLLIKRIASSDLDITLPGDVKLGQTLTTVFPGSNFISNVYPSGIMTLGNTNLSVNPPRYSSNLYTNSDVTGVRAGTSTSADLILIYNPTLGNGAGGYDQYYYSAGGLAGQGWRKVGGGNADMSDTVLASGRAILLKRVAGTPFNWVMPQPFPNP